MGRIEHGNVVGVLDVGTVGEAAYLVMEMLRGESLRSVIEREAPMPIERAIALLLPAMEGVEAAHRAGVVHRDLKPENLFVTTDGRVKILDFGLAKLTQAEPALAGASALGFLRHLPFADTLELLVRKARRQRRHRVQPNVAAMCENCGQQEAHFFRIAATPLCRW